jgi:hypothetical protein
MEKVVGQKDVTSVRDMFVEPKNIFKTVPKLKPASKCDQLSSDFLIKFFGIFSQENQGNLLPNIHF